MNCFRSALLTGLLFSVLLPGACRRPATRAALQDLPAQEGVRVLTDTNRWASDPYLAEDHLGNPVLCWTEKPLHGERYLLKYAVFDTASSAFLPPVTVTTSLGTKTSAESAGRVAFKSDGTVVALFGKRFNDPDNRFAGAIQYSLSEDAGASWSPPAYLHSDTLHRHGRGFFDMATLANGELGAVWLDGRYGEADTGSALFFAATLPGGGFGPDKMIGSSTCECCRTDLLVDPAGVIHLAYRDILFPPDRMGRQVRDMVYTRSTDNGASFGPPMRISADNWEVAGCPHAGPSLAAGAGNNIRAVWFTAGEGPDEGMAARTASGPGVYQASLLNGRGVFNPRKLLSTNARHPQLEALPDGRFAITWDETNTAGERGAPGNTGDSGDSGATTAMHKHGHQTSGSQEQTGNGPAVVLQFSDPAGETTTMHVTDGSSPAHHPVLASPAPGQVLLAWVAETGGTSTIAYRVVEVPF